MNTTKRFLPGTMVPVVISILIAATTVRAQWLTKADECRSSRQDHARIKARDSKKWDSDHDAGIGDAMKWYWGQRNFGLGYIPKNALHTAYVQTNAMRAAGGKGASPEAAAPQWTLDGPTTAGGRIESIAINPLNPNTVYAGSANGGVWKTQDAGNTWVPITDNQESIAMGSLGIDPEDTNIVFAGTGEFPSTNDSYAGYGLLRSSDGGKTWTNVGPTNVASYSRVIVNPKHSNLVYASAGRSGGGVLRSSDGGLTWAWLADTSLPQNTSVSDLALSMNGDVAVLYAGVVGKGVYQSTNGGDTWQRLQGLPFTDMVRISVDVEPSDWQSVVVLSVDGSGAAGQDNLEGIYYSDDGGQSWTEGDQQLKSNYRNGPFYEGTTVPPQGWYDVYIRVDPSDFSHWLLGGVPFWYTHDYGQDWSEDRSFHVDQHDAEFAPSDNTKVYLGSDGGVFYSPLGGDQVNSSSFNIPNSEFYTISTDQNKANLTYGGLQDNGVVTGSSQSNWDQFDPNIGDGAYTVDDPNNSGVIYYAATENGPERDDNGSISSMGLSPHVGDYVSWLNPIYLDSKDEILYFGLDHLYYTSNPTAASPSWTRCKTALYQSGDSQTSVQAIDAFGDKKTVLCGTSGGRVFITTNNGTSFTNVSAGLPGRWITSVKFNPSTATTFYVTCSGFGAGHVFKTTDNGAHWMNISSTLPDIPVNSIKMDPANPSVLYIGTDVGVFFSPNDGAQWLPYGTGLPNVAIDFMDIQIANRVLRVGTHGRSIWEVPLDDDETGIILPAQRSVWTLGDTASIQWRGFGESVTLDLSLDAGATWQNVATNVGGSAYRINSVNYPISENALVRVNDGNDTVISPLFVIGQQRAGDILTTVGELPLYLYDIAYDADDNVLWATDFNATDNNIYKIDPDKGTLLDSVKISPIQQPSTKAGFTGIKYDPVTKNLFLQQVNNVSATSWESYIYEVTKTGSVVNSFASPAEYGTGILVRGDTLLVADRMGPGMGVTATDQDQILRAFTSDWNFTDLNPLDFSSTRSAIYGPRGLTYDSKLNQYLLAYTDFEGSLTSSTFNGSYILFLDPVSGNEQRALSIVQGGSEQTNLRGMEYDPRGAGNTAWVTVLTGANSAALVKIALTDGPSSAPAAAFSADPGTVLFGNLDTGETKTIHVNIFNTGSASGTVQSIAIQPTGSEFTLGPVSLPATIPPENLHEPGDSLGVDITFSSHTPGAQSATLVITPSGAGIPTGDFSITGFGTVNGAGVAPDGTSYGWSLDLSPNPARNNFEADLAVDRATTAEIMVFDMTGRQVLSELLGTLSAGNHETDISTSNLPSGIYLVRVTGSNGEVASARLSIEK